MKLYTLITQNPGWTVLILIALVIVADIWWNITHPRKMPMVDVHKCKVTVTFNTRNKVFVKEFTGRALWSSAFGLLNETAEDKARQWMNYENAIKIDDDNYVPRSEVVNYKIHDIEKHEVPAEKL